jgi:hypothetical protein
MLSSAFALVRDRANSPETKSLQDDGCRWSCGHRFGSRWIDPSGCLTLIATAWPLASSSNSICVRVPSPKNVVGPVGRIGIGRLPSRIV